eukprot:TRINITY_DN25413_c0_g1_i1.p1 TRINITY_DN25413_c0_g1~~TRINITY_DN25413_c0_g1_i1.p1  ORF type:complete len:551 (+),score=149.98 TRINITY_DN25413_c0_g1_i1:96-1748(+)
MSDDYARSHAELKGMGLEEAAAKVLQEGLKAFPSDPALMRLAEQEKEHSSEEPVRGTASQAPSDQPLRDGGAGFAHSYSEFKEMGCEEAAQEVLRQGLRSQPSSTILRNLAEQEGLQHLEHQEDVDLTAPGAMMEHLRRREILMQQMHKLQQKQRAEQIKQWQASLQQTRFAPPPVLPEKLSPPPPPAKLKFSVEEEYPDPSKASKAIKAIVLGTVAGIAASVFEVCSANYFVWAFLGSHLLCIVLMRDYGDDMGLLAACAVLALHAGHAAAEIPAWLLSKDGDDSLGPWSVVVLLACILYMLSFLKECVILPPDYISTLSFFFPVFPAYDAAVALNCLELFVEWRYFPEYKFWTPVMLLGACFMIAGQVLVYKAMNTADRNFWASSREVEEDELVGLEIPNRRVVQEGPYAWERHPAYLGALLWGVGAELVLCNPVMLLLVSFVLWASLLHVSMEEEKELFEEFPLRYANYSALTGSWIPGFHALLESSAFQKEMTDNAEPEDEGPEEGDFGEEDEEEEYDEEDDLLWEGVPKGGALWNRQFQEPLRLG